MFVYLLADHSPGSAEIVTWYQYNDRPWCPVIFEGQQCYVSLNRQNGRCFVCEDDISERNDADMAMDCLPTHKLRLTVYKSRNGTCLGDIGSDVFTFNEYHHLILNGTDFGYNQCAA